MINVFVSPHENVGYVWNSNGMFITFVKKVLKISPNKLLNRSYKLL